MRTSKAHEKLKDLVENLKKDQPNINVLTRSVTASRSYW